MLKYPDAQVISLGIGDTTEPIPDVITSAMSKVWSFCYYIQNCGYCQKQFLVFPMFVTDPSFCAIFRVVPG